MNEITNEQFELLSAMKEAGFLVEDFIDEKKVLKYQHYMGKMNQSIFGLTIAPT